MKHALAAIALAIPLAASAWEVEASIGHTQFQKTDNGIWWQNGLPYVFNTQSPSYSIGVTDYLTPSTRWRVAYTYLGHVNSVAQATSDANYNGVDGCRTSPCAQWDTFRTEGSVRGFSFTLAPEMQIGAKTKAFVEAGVFVFLPKFYAEVASCQACVGTWRNEYREGWKAGLQLGAGIEYGKTQFVLTAHQIDAATPDPNAIPNWHGWAVNAAMRYRFWKIEEFLK